MLENIISIDRYVYLHFCPHLAARKPLETPAGEFCSHLAARKRLDSLAGDFCSYLAARKPLCNLAGDTVDQSAAFFQKIDFPSLGCETVQLRAHSKEELSHDQSGCGCAREQPQRGCDFRIWTRFVRKYVYFRVINAPTVSLPTA